MLADVSAIIGSLDIVFGEIDRWRLARCCLDKVGSQAHDRESRRENMHAVSWRCSAASAR
jgi:hypothetical protein